jgi:hypothetical protein
MGKSAIVIRDFLIRCQRELAALSSGNWLHSAAAP